MNPFKRKNDQVTTAVLLDTSGLIDGRIVQIAKAGFVPRDVVVPQFVIAELQFLADHGDSHKRERARYGLDVIRELQDIRRVDVTIARDKFASIKEVDDKLVAMAKQYGAQLYTTDFNLNKVAQIEGIVVLNVNELAQALRPNLLPGERVVIKLTQLGQDRTQGVGYLGDGTMVVVEQGAKYVGQQVQATCTRILQTQAGKMMFATLASKQGAVPAAEAQVKPAAAGNQKREHPQQRPQTEPAQQSEQKRTQRRHRGGRGNTNHGGQQHEQPQKPQAQPKQPANRPAHTKKRRLSPEDKLLATLQEIDKQ